MDPAKIQGFPEEAFPKGPRKGRCYECSNFVGFGLHLVLAGKGSGECGGLNFLGDEVEGPFRIKIVL